ncbi:hypothetical protein ELH26_34675 [Rhizobium leguminosarum]|uniref:hypothetical protein n=1 Tax=Rhizobium leguminosarum TaxID=384 RepID=UPI0010320B83|nr:hypothetical protein [Rhizobium leguminosarum]TBC86461.1 hypothetical protein ELH26_34675 [Rhizobium leguminosarum]
MKFRLPAMVLSALVATSATGAEDQTQPPYFAALLARPGLEIEACYTTILAREGLDSPACASALGQIWIAQKAAKVNFFDFRDKDGFKKMVAKLTSARNQGREDRQSQPISQQVRDNMEIVVSVARTQFKDDRVSQCLTEIRYRGDASSPYCDYTLALLNLALFTSTEIPRIKMRREDMAAVLEQALPTK